MRPRPRFCLAPDARRLLAAALNIAVAAALLAVAAWFLQGLARRQLTDHLRDDAAHALMLNATGDTPYRWQFVGSEDIVAGRVFGADEFSFADGELRVVSPGNPFEIGLPLKYAADLRRFTQLRMNAASDAPVQVRVVARERLDADEITSAAVVLNERVGMLDLAALSWTVAQPQTAAMLRLSFDLPRGHLLHLKSVSLSAREGARRVDLTHVAPASVVGPAFDAAAVARYARAVGVEDTPIYLLAQSGRVEQRLLALRDIRAISPAAIVIPEEAQAATYEQARQPGAAERLAAGHPMRWTAAAIFVLVLALARLRPPRNARLRALLEVLLLLAIPLWLIADGQFTGRIDALQGCLIIAATIYAISLGFPRAWTWNGSVRAWLLAAAVVALALLIGVILHDGALRSIGAAHIARYLGWALAQQYLICALCLPRWRTATGSAAAAVYLSALGFALLHTPNASLMLATFAGGLLWGALYLRERALLPLATSHAASAMLLTVLLPPQILLSAEVSVRFFQ